VKIAVASDDEVTITSHFGRTRGFVVFDVNNGNKDGHVYRLNDFTGHARGLEHEQHSHDHHGPILAALADCQVVIARGMGMRIYQDLQQVNKQVFITDQVNVDQAVDAYLTGNLSDHPERGCPPHDHEK